MTTKEVKEIKNLDDEEILEEAYKAVAEKLGLAGFTRFTRLIKGGTGNWTEEREKALEKLNQMDIDELIDYIHRNTKGPQEGQKVVE